MKQGFHQLKINLILQRLLCILLTIYSVCGIFGCSADTHDKNPDTAQVQLPWFDGNSYSLQHVSLSTIKDMVTLRGSSARFLMAPGEANGQLVGVAPKIKTMRTNDGVYIPEDYLSVQLLSLYAHFEKLADLDKQLGLGQLISNWPRQETVAVSVQVSDPSGQMGTDNAMYTGDYDAYLFLPYTRSDLPSSVNAGVIGHEHFHSLFYQKFIKASASKYPFSTQPASTRSDTAHPIAQILQSMGLPILMPTESHIDAKSAEADQKTDQKTVVINFGNGQGVSTLSAATARDQYHAFLLRSLNEGLADIWGWVYSGDTKFVQRSAPEFDSRNLNYVWRFSLTASQISNLSLRTKMSANTPILDPSIYQVGTVYANRLWQAVQVSLLTSGKTELQARQELAQGIMRAIMKLQTEFIALDTNSNLDPIRPLELLQAELPELKINLNVSQ